MVGEKAAETRAEVVLCGLEMVRGAEAWDDVMGCCWFEGVDDDAACAVENVAVAVALAAEVETEAVVDADLRAEWARKAARKLEKKGR